MQQMVWFITLAAIGLIAAVFVFVGLGAGRARNYDRVQAGAYRFRSWLFAALIVLGIVVASATLRGLPYVAAGTDTPPTVVTVTAYQWYWELDRDSVSAGQPVELRISSADVNHGLGIYDPQYRLIAQAQAMPGYVNRLRYTFETPGVYRLMCLEYCGTAHHDMIEEITVLAPGEHGNDRD